MRHVVFAALAVIYVGLLFAASLVPAGTLGDAYRLFGVASDNVLHFFGFFFLGFFIHLMLSQEKFKVRLPLLWSTVLSLGLAGLGEILQRTQATRHATLFDFGINCAGILGYMLVALIFLWVFRMTRGEGKARAVDT